MYVPKWHRCRIKVMSSAGYLIICCLRPMVPAQMFLCRLISNDDHVCVSVWSIYDLSSLPQCPMLINRLEKCLCTETCLYPN